MTSRKFLFESLPLLALCFVAIHIIEDDFKRGVGQRAAEAAPIFETDALDMDADSVNAMAGPEALVREEPKAELPSASGVLADKGRLVARRSEIQQAFNEERSIENSPAEEEDEEEEEEEEEEDGDGDDEGAAAVAESAAGGELTQAPISPNGGGAGQQAGAAATKQPAQHVDPNDKPRILKGWGLGAGSWMLG